MKKVFALVDCNNFYASCERVFQPHLRNTPIVVLSNNDGCIIARSEEAKDIGMRMGAPIFKHKDLIEKHKVKLFSANFTLYGDLSSRVMKTISYFTPHYEIYSIDEAFISFDNFDPKEYGMYGKNIQAAIKKWVGIPVSIGIAPTKTLAKLANEVSKKYNTKSGVLNLMEANIDEYLHRTDVFDIWGIGRNSAQFLYTKNIYTALQLKNAPDLLIKKNLGVTGLRIVWELRGISCLQLEEISGTKKGILSSRSFGKPVQKLEELKEAVAHYTTRAAEKLRQEKCKASFIHVWIVTNRFKKTEFQYSNSFTIPLTMPTAYTPSLISAAHKCLNNIYKKGYNYKKASVTLTGLIPNHQTQLNMFEKSNNIDKQDILMKTIDQLNLRHGTKTIRFAAQGLDQDWYMRSSLRSDLYTTDWNQILNIKI